MSFFDDFMGNNKFNFELSEEPINSEFIEARKKEYSKYMEEIAEKKDTELKEKGLPWLRASFFNSLIGNQIMIWYLIQKFPDKEEELGECLKLLVLIQSLLLGGMVALDWQAHKAKTREEELRLLEQMNLFQEKKG